MMPTIELNTDSSGVTTLTLSRPEVRNAFNAELISELTSAVRELPASTRVLVLQGAGRAFSAGADLEWMTGMSKFSREENIADSRALREMFEVLDGAAVPVVAKVHGAAIAGATGLVACCDYVVAAAGTQFAFTEVKLGLVPAVISPFVIRKVGYSFARAMFLTAERFDADRALQAGLVHRVVPESELESAVGQVVESLLAAGPKALARAKRLVEEIAGKRPEEAGQLTVEAIADVRVGEEAREGVAAFLERRPPNWGSGGST